MDGQNFSAIDAENELCCRCWQLNRESSSCEICTICKNSPTAASFPAKYVGVVLKRLLNS